MPNDEVSALPRAICRSVDHNCRGVGEARRSGRNSDGLAFEVEVLVVSSRGDEDSVTVLSGIDSRLYGGLVGGNADRRLGCCRQTAGHGE